MHLLLIHQVFLTPKNPGGTRHYELADFLVRRGHQVTAIASDVDYLTGEAFGNLEDNDSIPGIVIKRAHASSKHHSSYFARLTSYFTFMFSAFFCALKVKDVDIVFGTSPPLFQGISALLIARLKRRPFVFEVRDLWPDFVVQIGVLKNPLVISLARAVEKVLYKKANALIINSPGFEQHLIDKGAKPEKIYLVPNGVNPAMFNPEGKGNRFREEHNLEGKFVALYAGAIGKSNDTGVLVRTAELLRDQEEIVIVLIGAGNELENMKEYANSMSLSNILFLSPVPKEEMPDVLAAADACIAILKNIRLFKTVYPNKVFDYMAAARPVILAIDGVIRDLVDKANAGIFVQPGCPEKAAEAIRFLANNTEVAKRMGNNGRTYVESNFNREDQAMHFEEILLQVISCCPS